MTNIVVRKNLKHLKFSALLRYNIPDLETCYLLFDLRHKRSSIYQFLIIRRYWSLARFTLQWPRLGSNKQRVIPVTLKKSMGYLTEWPIYFSWKHYLFTGVKNTTD